jgi:hypothetical protein
VTVANTVTVALDANSLSALEQVTVTVGAAVSVSNFPATQTVAGTVTANVVGTREFIDLNSTTVSGFLTVGGWDYVNASHAPIPLNDSGTGVNISFDGLNGVPLPVVNHGSAAFFATVTVGNTVTVAGTVTANPAGTQTIAGTVTVGNTVTVAGTVTANPAGTQTVAGTVQVGNEVTVKLQGINSNGQVEIVLDGGGIPVYPRDNSNLNASFPVNVGNTVTIAGTVTANPTGTQTIAGTVTVGNLPSGALTTRFGSVVTAGTAQLTSAVTNASRKYLLLQNISTGAVTVGVGFVPTTTQGIALAAGAGLTFDAFCPTGAVHWLGATTGAPFTILEG